MQYQPPYVRKNTSSAVWSQGIVIDRDAKPKGHVRNLPVQRQTVRRDGTFALTLRPGITWSSQSLSCDWPPGCTGNTGTKETM